MFTFNVVKLLIEASNRFSIAPKPALKEDMVCIALSIDSIEAEAVATEETLPQ